MRIGKITENALKRSVLKLIKTEQRTKTSAAVGADCAFSESNRVFSAVSPMSLDIEDGAFYAVMKATNSLISQGIKPDHVIIAIMLPEDAEEPYLKQIVRDGLKASALCGVTYAGGHTEVSKAVNRPIISATCVGYEKFPGGEELYASKPRAGQELVISKWIGLEGTAMLANEREDILKEKYPAPFIDGAKEFKQYLSVLDEMSVISMDKISSIKDLSNGGVFAALWDMASKAGCGIKVDLRKIPVRQETIEICEYFEINPYELLSGGALLIVTDDGKALVAELKKNGIPAAVVGKLCEGNDKVIYNLDESRFLDKPAADEILKVLG